MLNKRSNKTHNSRDNSNHRERSGICFSNVERAARAVDSYAGSLSLEQIIDTLNIDYLEMYDRPLKAVEILLLEGIWQNKTYGEIALENNYSPTYMTNVAAPKLFKGLSQLLKCRIIKRNCCSKLAKYIRENTSLRSTSYGREKKTNRHLDKTSDNYYSFRRGKSDQDLFLRDAVLFAQIN